MANTSISGQQTSGISSHIPKLLVRVNKSPTILANVAHGHPSSDPTADGFFNWSDPQLTLFTRDMTQDILDLNPVIIMQRYLTNARNPYHGEGYNGSGVKRWVVPGNSSFDGEKVNAGNSSTNRYGVSISEVPNFIPMQQLSEGYNHHYNYVLPVSRFTSDRGAGTYLQQLTRAIPVSEWNDVVTYSQHKNKRNFNMLFKISLGIPNPDFELNKSQNPYLIGEGQTIVVYPRLQTFDDGGGIFEYYTTWSVKVRE